MVKVVLFLAGLGMILETQAFAQKSYDVCNIHEEENVCQVASLMARLLNEKLPRPLNDSVTMEKANAVENKVHITLRLGHDQSEEFRKVLTSSPGESASLKGMIARTIMVDACQDANTFGFIRDGGALNYQFLYIDNQPFTTVNVDHCE